MMIGDGEREREIVRKSEIIRDKKCVYSMDKIIEKFIQSTESSTNRMVSRFDFRYH